MNWRQLILISISTMGLPACTEHLSAQESASLTSKPLPQQDSLELEAQIAELIEQLGASNYQQREAARWELQRIGLAAFEQLRLAAERHPSIEVANTARYILESRQVTWHLDTDSLEVREILASYHRLNETERLSRIGLLIKHQTTDAILALCRITRFDFDRPAKSAALGIIEILSETNEPDQNLVESLKIELGDGLRPSLQWVRQALIDLETKVDVEAWRKLAIAETELPRAANDMGESQQLALSFCTRISFWINQHASDEDAAIEFARPHLKLVKNTKYELDRFARTLLDQLNAPRLVVYLRDVHQNKFDQYPGLLYLLAESHRKLGEEELAKEYAQRATDLLGNPSEETKSISRRNDLELDELIASNRFQVAGNLQNRGMFDWAKNEFSQTLEFKSRYDRRVRTRFSEFLWTLGQYREAANVLRPVAEQYLDADNNPTQPNNPTAELSSYLYYEGLALSEEGASKAGWETLMRAYRQNTVDFDESETLSFDLPDIVIAMHQASTLATEFRDEFEQAFNRVVKRMRSDVIRSEDALSRAPNRELRRQQEANLANACNQLAWLLSKCEMNHREAVSLGRRAVELMPREAVFQDTLGRAYFSAGEIAKAISAQKRAIELAPNDPQLRRQLVEFNTALNGN